MVFVNSNGTAVYLSKTGHFKMKCYENAGGATPMKEFMDRQKANQGSKIKFFTAKKTCTEYGFKLQPWGGKHGGNGTEGHEFGTVRYKK